MFCDCFLGVIWANWILSLSLYHQEKWGWISNLNNIIFGLWCGSPIGLLTIDDHSAIIVSFSSEKPKDWSDFSSFSSDYLCILSILSIQSIRLVRYYSDHFDRWHPSLGFLGDSQTLFKPNSVRNNLNLNFLKCKIFGESAHFDAL